MYRYLTSLTNVTSDSVCIYLRLFSVTDYNQWRLVRSKMWRGGKEAHKLAGIQSSLIRIIRVSKPRRHGSASPGQHNGNCLHKENGGHPFPVPVQGEPSVVVTSHQEEHHHSLSSVAFHIGEHRGRFPQQIQTAEVGLQTSIIRVLEDCHRFQIWLTLDAFTSRGSHQIPRYMTWEEDSRATAINPLDYYWDPVTWLFPPVPLIPLALEGVLEQQIKVILICPEWTGAM